MPLIDAGAPLNDVRNQVGYSSIKITVDATGTWSLAPTSSGRSTNFRSAAQGHVIQAQPGVMGLLTKSVKLLKENGVSDGIAATRKLASDRQLERPPRFAHKS
jgi:hypothetical protein